MQAQNLSSQSRFCEDSSSSIISTAQRGTRVHYDFEMPEFQTETLPELGHSTPQIRPLTGKLGQYPVAIASAPARLSPTI